MPWEKRRSGTFRLLKDSGRQDSGSLLAESYEDDQFFDAEEENSVHEIECRINASCSKLSIKAICRHSIQD